MEQHITAHPRLNPSPTTGLSAQEVLQQRARGLGNTQPPHNTKTVWQIIRDNTFTLFNAFNFGIGLCLALVGAYRDLLYLIVIITNILIGIIQEIRSKKMVESLSLLSTPKALVLRDGQESEVAVDELVLDDITVLRMGRQICADAVVVTGEVEVNEALLTGEAESIRKQPGDLLLSGSFIVSGKCHAQVEHVGADNYADQIAREAKQYKKVHSDLMNSLNRIVKFTSVFILPLGVLLVLQSLLLRHASIYDTVTTVSAALLGMLPKGLVLLTSVSLAVGVIKLARQKTLVQELFCIETLSRVDMLCLDKTGTITQGKMNVTQTIPLGPAPQFDLGEAIGAFTVALDDNNATFLALREHFSHPADWHAVAQTPFSSARKWSSVTFREIGTLLIGAPDILLRGQDFTLPAQIHQLEKDGCRILLAAHTGEPVSGSLPAQLTPLAAIVLQDPIRPDAKETLSFFAREGVTLKIISGDNPATVSSIARQAGLEFWDSYVDASQLQDEDAIRDACEKYTIFGRVSPSQKRQLVHALQERGHTVAMTGDGVNDVLALKDADCSIAMASGSDAARQISQLVLLESDFTSLPSVVMEGRRVINNITRTATLFLVKTIFSFLLSFLSLILNVPYSFVPLQLTLLGATMEGIPAFFLTFEPNHNRIEGHFLTRVLQQAFPCALIITLNILLVNLFAGNLGLDTDQCSTLVFFLTGFVWLMQLLRVCRPFTVMRAVLCAGMAAIFILASYLFFDLLRLAALPLHVLPFAVLLAVISFPLFYLLSFATHKFGLWLERRRAERAAARS